MPGRNNKAKRQRGPGEKHRDQGHFMPLMAFLLPLAVMITVFIAEGVSPFGDKCIMIIDSYHQYVPFFSEFHYKIWHDQSMLYSWHGSLGYNFWTVQAYYLASPLNLIIAIFPESMMIEAFQTLIVLKICLSGLTAYIYLRKRTGRNDLTTVIFAAFYALGGFMLAYNWNVMWLDCVVLLPLIVMGAEKLILHGDGRLYTITLGLAIFCNYYIAIMICIFLVLYFFVVWFSQVRAKKPAVPVHEAQQDDEDEEYMAALLADEEPGRDGASAALKGFSKDSITASPRRFSKDSITAASEEFGKDGVTSASKESGKDGTAAVSKEPGIIKRGIHYLLCSMLALGLACTYLLPTFYTMINSSTGYSPDHWEFYRSFWDMFKQHFAMLEPTQLSGAPNIYCGTAVIILAVMFAAAKQIPVRERILKISLAAFMLISLNVNVLNYIWHGFHFPNNLPGRFSFIYIFLLIVMAYDAFQSLELTRGLVFGIISAGIGAVYVLSMIFAKEEIKPEAKIVTGILLGVYIAALAACRKKVRWKFGPTQLLASVMLAELFANSIYGFAANGSVTRSIYMSKSDEMAQIRDEYSPGNKTFYRMESAQIQGRDDIVRYNMNGLSFFSSTCDDRMEKLMGALGFYNAGNKYSYKGATPLTDAMLGIRYVISDSALPAQNLQLADKTDDLMVYENYQNLSVGYMVSSDVLDWNIIEGEPFTIQNDFAYLAADCEDNIFNRMDVPDPEISEGDITYSEDDTWHYSSTITGGVIRYDLTFESDDDVYIYFEAANCDELKVIRDGTEQSYTDERGHIVHLGMCHEGDEVTLEFPMNSENLSGNIVLQMASFDEEAFEEAYSALSKSQLDITSSSCTELSGSIKAEDDGIMMLSVPYDEGWTITIDGKKVKQFEVGEGLTGVDLEAGTHIVRMTYTPKGFAAGTLISVISLALLWILCGMPLPVKGRLRRSVL